MASVDKRLQDIIAGLGPENKARLVIEDVYRDEPILSPLEIRRMLLVLGSEEGRRYNAVIARHQVLGDNLDRMGDMVLQVHICLLERDRMLWYIQALEELEETIQFKALGEDSRKVLLADNPNIMPGKPLELRVPFATFRLGVSGKKREPYGKWQGVEMSRAVEVGLDAIAQRIWNLTGELKALFSHVIKEAEDLEFDFLKGLAVTMVRDIKDWDQPTINTLLRQSKEMEAQWDEEGLTHKQKLERILEEDSEPRGRAVPISG